MIINFDLLSQSIKTASVKEMLPRIDNFLLGQLYSNDIKSKKLIPSSTIFRLQSDFDDFYYRKMVDLNSIQIKIKEEKNLIEYYNGKKQKQEYIKLLKVNLIEFEKIKKEIQDKKRETITYEPLKEKVVIDSAPTDAPEEETPKAYTKPIAESVVESEVKKESGDSLSYKIEKSKHTKTGADIWILKFKDELGWAKFELVKKAISDNFKGYYSRFVHGFVFDANPGDRLAPILFASLK